MVVRGEKNALLKKTVTTRKVKNLVLLLVLCLTVTPSQQNMILQ